MSNAYIHFADDTVRIGNDYIERALSVKDNKLFTVEIINKRINGGKFLKFKKYSAEFFVALKKKKVIGYSTDFISSNDLVLDNFNVFNHRVEFIFKPYSYDGVPIVFVVNIEIEDDKHYMEKSIEMMIEPEKQHLIVVDYIDCEHICAENIEQKWNIGNIDKAYLSKYHSALGQPFYLNGMFFGSTFPLAENNIVDQTAYIRYFSGKRFDMMNLNCGHTYKTWKTVVGAARSLDFEIIRQDFLKYIRDISRNIGPRFQYNSWYDHMHDITNENISKSFKEIEKNLSKTLVPPLDSYVVDDGFVDWKADFWCFNEKFPNELYPASSLARKFSSNFGLWNGPRGGYTNETGNFGKRMEKAGKGGYNRASNDVCVSSHEYIKNITEYFLDNMRKFDINYWKLDGFLLKACPSKKHGHLTGGYNDMYQYTEMWENWIDIFRKLRIEREHNGKDMWINQTSYCNASPWFLQWADSLWIQNSGDIDFIDKTPKGEKLSDNDADRVLTYRDDRYYDFCVTRNYQFPCEYLYNHDPIYGNTAKISMSDEDYRRYMLMMTTRGTAFWELYYSYNMFNEAKWRINADALRFVRNEYKTLKTARFIGGSPAQSECYGYSSWSKDNGIVSLRNPANRPQTFKLTLNALIGVCEGANGMKMAKVYPYTENCDGKLYNYGDILTIELEPLEVVIMKFSSKQEKKPSLIYGRFDSPTEVLLFFDDRVYFDSRAVSSDAEILKVDILEDYSTLKVTFQEPQTEASVSLTVKNAFGETNDAEFNGKYYESFICKDGLIPNERDFTLFFTLKGEENGTVLNCNDVISVIRDNGFAKIKLQNNESISEDNVATGDRLALVREPNGLVKLYVNGELSCSVYTSGIADDLINSSVELCNATDLKILSRALSYDEIEE